MAKEVNIQAALSCQRFAPAMLVGAGSMDIDQGSTNKRSSSQYQTLSNTNQTQIAIGTVPHDGIGCVFIKNLNDDTKTATISVGPSGTYTPFAKLAAGQFW